MLVTGVIKIRLVNLLHLLVNLIIKNSIGECNTRACNWGHKDSIGESITLGCKSYHKEFYR